MRKFIAFGFLILTIALLFGQGLHRIKKNTKIEGWLSVRGDIYAPWHEKYDIGKRAYWYDSMFLAHPQFRDILVWSADSTDTTFVTPTLVKSRRIEAETCSVTVLLPNPKVCENIFINTHSHDWLGNGQNTISDPSYPLLSGFSFDSLICDSVRLGFWAQEDTNIVDSLYIASLYGRTASTVVILADGTDATSGSVGYHYKTYVCSATIPANARLAVQMKPGRESAGGKIIVRILLLYGHPK